MEKIYLKTSDGIKIAGNWFDVASPKKYVFLLHMMPALKESWNEFAKKLNKAGFSAFAIDLRGHGESTENGKLNYKNFTDAEHQKYRLDVETGLLFLKEQGAKLQDIYLCGASIGANLTIEFMGKHKEIKKGIALSPGLNYHGLQTEDFIKNLDKDQQIYLLASEKDIRSYQCVKELKKMRPEQIKENIYRGAEHGTDLFEIDKKLMEELVNWLNN